jgi:hypothetical protein
MHLLRRVLTTIAVTVAVILICIYWVAPVALSFYAARAAVPVAKVVPTELQDRSVSQAVGPELSYLGYEFEVPWNDLDESKTNLYPKNKSEKTMADLHFRSGLRIILMAAQPRAFANQFSTDFRVPPSKLDAIFGAGSSISDYTFVKNVYEFSPAKMHFWSLSDRLHYREDMLLTIKSIMPVKAAETGIFRIQNADYKGFQQGDPRTHPERVDVDLYDDNGGFEIIFGLKGYHNPTGLTQPEINRVVQSLRKSLGNSAVSGRSGDESASTQR